MKRFLFFTILLSLTTFVAKAQWEEQATGFSEASRGIRSISIVDANTVWVNAYDGSADNANVQEFSKTTDGGATWTAGTIDIGNTSLGIAMIDAISATTAYVVAYTNSSNPSNQGIYITTDGGASWDRQTSADYQGSGSFSNVVYFWDENNGFCMGDPESGEFEIYTTTDGGSNWVRVNGANIPNPLSGEYGYVAQYAAYGDHVWFTTNKGRIYHSADKGYTWTVAQTPSSDLGGGTFDFASESNGLIIDEGSLYETTDGGASWTELTVDGYYSTDIAQVPGIEGTYFTTGNSEGVSYTNFNGHVWSELTPPGQVLETKWFDASTGWVGSFNTDENTGGIYKFTGTIPTPLDDDLAVSALNNPTTIGGALTSNENIEVTITNLGYNPQSNFDIVYSVNGGTAVSETVSSTINPGESLNYTFTQTEDFSVKGDYNIIVATQLSGDENTDNDTLNTDVYLYFPKKILHEQFTTEKCPNCPPVLAYFDGLREKYAPHLITMTHHSGFYTDFLTNQTATDMLAYFNNGGSTSAPAGMFDRHYNGLDNDNYNGTDPGPVFWNGSPYGETRIKSRALPAYVSVNITGLFNPDSRKLEIEVSGEFAKAYTEDLSINVWLTEDHIAEKSQASAPDGFEHRYTQRQAVTNYKGDLLVSGGTSIGDTYTKSFVVDSVDGSWDIDNMYIVAFVGDKNSDVNKTEVHNANQITISSIVKVSELNKALLNIYPNPTTGLVNIENVEGSTIELVNILGQSIITINNAKSVETLDLSGNKSGTYIVRVKRNNTVVTKKLIYVK